MQITLIETFQESSARLSECGRYRYDLIRRWREDGLLANFIMLNPSTADANMNDPTIERCIRRVQHFDMAGLVVTNLFALRATDPQALRHEDDPVGPDNDGWLQYHAQMAGMVICAWGNHGALNGRAAAVVYHLLAHCGIDLYCLTQTGAGEPGHPLYLPYETEPALWLKRYRV